MLDSLSIRSIKYQIVYITNDKLEANNWRKDQGVSGANESSRYLNLISSSLHRAMNSTAKSVNANSLSIAGFKNSIKGILRPVGKKPKKGLNVTIMQEPIIYAIMETDFLPGKRKAQEVKDLENL